jgi:alkanesulfonate monooxygenase SsuD/methylene tetrahydromethanopterin reductase-like flavin-dependent oxidoreductase (luciferase family)
VASLPVCVTDDVSRAQDRIGRWFESVGELPSYRRALDAEQVSGVGDISLVGDEGTVVDALRRVEDVGVTEFAAMITAGRDERAATMEVLARAAG